MGYSSDRIEALSFKDTKGKVIELQSFEISTLDLFLKYCAKCVNEGNPLRTTEDVKMLNYEDFCEFRVMFRITYNFKNTCAAPTTSSTTQGSSQPYVHNSESICLSPIHGEISESKLSITNDSLISLENSSNSTTIKNSVKTQVVVLYDDNMIDDLFEDKDSNINLDNNKCDQYSNENLKCHPNLEMDFIEYVFEEFVKIKEDVKQFGIFIDSQKNYIVEQLYSITNDTQKPIYLQILGSEGDVHLFIIQCYLLRLGSEGDVYLYKSNNYQLYLGSEGDVNLIKIKLITGKILYKVNYSILLVYNNSKGILNNSYDSQNFAYYAKLVLIWWYLWGALYNKREWAYGENILAIKVSQTDSNSRIEAKVLSTRRRKANYVESVAVYVDDLSFAMKDPQSFVNTLESRYNFKVKGTGPLELYPGSNFEMNATPIYWYSKKMATVETATYGAEFVAARTCVEQIIDLRNTLRYLGVPVVEKSYMFGDNDSVFNSSNNIYAKLHKRHNILSFHRVQEAIASKYVEFVFLNGKDNPADILSKHWAHSKIYLLLCPVLFWSGDTLESK